MTSTQKVTFNLPTELKNEVIKLKDDLKVSLNTIYKNAIAEYVERQEIQRWEKAANIASKDKKYLKLCEDLSNTKEDIYEY